MVIPTIPIRSLSLTSKLRYPMIKFRYGPGRDHHQTTGASGSPGDISTHIPQAGTGEPIYDFQIPQRWKRRPITEEEIAQINSGGSH